MLTGVETVDDYVVILDAGNRPIVLDAREAGKSAARIVDVGHPLKIFRLVLGTHTVRNDDGDGTCFRGFLAYCHALLYAIRASGQYVPDPHVAPSWVS